ncbi:MAG: hypothetical protein HY319_06750 [Armatimonadetes bacterium]|nr:hypothetical protein [Armatimonadota bacterium]
MGNKRSAQRGTLITVLMVLILVFGVLVVSIAANLFQLSLRHQDDAREGARRLAESAVRVLIARLLQDPTLTPAACPSIELTLESYPGARGAAALDPNEASRLSVPLSVNNLTGSGNRPGWGDTVVKAESANVVGVGRYRGREQKIEAILHIPRFPYVVASSVPIRADRLHVFGVNEPSALSSGFGAVPPELKEPGHIATNAPDQTGPSLQLMGDTTIIEGDAQSRGSVEVGPGAVVMGELRPLAELAPLPQIDVRSLDTATRPGVSTLTGGALGATTLSGFNRRAGNLSIDGGLALNGGVLFVDGTVSIRGGLSGTGAVIATGPVRVEGGGSLSGLNGTAVIASGAIELQGSSSQQADFRGLLYTEGDLNCRYTNVAGSVVVNNPNPAGGVDLERSTLVESPALGLVTVPVVTTVPGPAGGLTPFPPTLHANLITSGDPYGFGVGAVTQTLSGTTQTAPVLFTANMNGPREDYSAPPAGFPVTHPPTAAEPWYEIGVPNPMPADPVNLGSIRVNNPDPAGECDSIDSNGVGWQNAFRGDFTDRDSARAALIQVAQDWGSSNATAATDQFLSDAAQWMIDEAPEIVRIWNENSRLLAQSTGSSAGTGPGIRTVLIWQLDLSQFYNLSDRIRLLSWREL